MSTNLSVYDELQTQHLAYGGCLWLKDPKEA